MDKDELIASQRFQLEILQTRIGLHGSRMWQLPLTYLGAIALAVNAAANEKYEISLFLVFGFMTVLGCILLWCLYGAEEGYSRAIKNMNEIERLLGLEEYTISHPAHRLPYYGLMIFGIVSCLLSTMYFWPACNH